MSYNFSVPAEELESRVLLSSAAVSKGVLTIIGDLKTANSISVHRSSDSTVTVSINGREQDFGLCDQITRVVIEGGNQADRLVINEDDRLLNLPVLMNGKIGDDTLIGSAGRDTLNGGIDDDSIDGNGGN